MPLKTHTRCLEPFVAHLRSRGVEPDVLLRRHGLERIVGTDVLAPVAALRGFFEDTAELCADPFVGLHVAQTLQRGQYGMVEFAARSSTNVREALLQFVRFGPLINPLVEYALEVQGVGACFTHRIRGDPGGLGRQVNEYSIAAILTGVRELSGRALIPQRVWFANSRPDDVGPLVEHFGTTRLDFDAPESGLAFEGGVLELPVITADPPLAHELTRHTERLLREQPAPGDPVGEARAALRRLLEAGEEPTIERVAATLHTTARTLQRRLAESQTRFADMLDDQRRKLARLYLENRSLTLAEIASRLGYSEPRAFQRAFKRWTGITPGQFRDAG